MDKKRKKYVIIGRKKKYLFFRKTRKTITNMLKYTRYHLREKGVRI